MEKLHMARTIFRAETVWLKFLVAAKLQRPINDKFVFIVSSVPTIVICSTLKREKNNHVRSVLCNVLRRKGDHAAAQTLMDVAKGTRNSRVRAAAVEALGAIRAKQAGRLLLSILRNTHERTYVRNNAALALGLVGYKPAVTDLIRFLKSQNWTIRAASANALGALNSGQTALLSVVKKEKHEWTRQIMRRSIQQKRRTGGVPPGPA